MSADESPPGPGKEKANGQKPIDLALHVEAAGNITICNLSVKWIRNLDLAQDAIIESKSGDIAMAAKNLIESASQMLITAVEMQQSQRQ
jgi:hypothetical protein